MVFGPLIGAAFGTAAGVAIGGAVFAGDRPKSLAFLSEAADRDDSVRTPAAANVGDAMRALLPLTPEWTTYPDYDRWVMINRVVRLMWPDLTGAILDEVVKGLKPTLQGVLADLPLPSFLSIEDITLGPTSLLDAAHADRAALAARLFTLGDRPVRVAGMKVYSTAEDACTLETPLMWGSNAAIELSVYVRVGPLRLVIPVALSDIQYKLLVRVTLSLVDTVPCIGGATLSLLAPPHVDYKLRFMSGLDVMAIPGVGDAVKYVVQYVCKELLLYPNSVSVPLMTNFGAPPHPAGMLHVRLDRIEGFKTNDAVGKGDPYVVFSVRDGRGQRSKVAKVSKGAARYGEEFYLVVDDADAQLLTIEVYDSDFGPQDELMGRMQLRFTEEAVETDPATGGQSVVYRPRACVAAPMTEERLALPIVAPPGPALARLGLLGSVAGAAIGAAATVGGAVGGLVGLHGGRGGGGEPAKATIKVATKFAEVRKKREAAAGAGAIAPRETVVDESGQAWEQMAEPAARTLAIKQLAKAEADAEAARLAKLPKKARAAALEEKAKKAKEEDARVVLVDEEVQLRGNETPADAAAARAAAGGAKIKPNGTVHLSLTFMPFSAPEFDDDVEMKPAKAGLAAYVPFEPPRPREIVTNVSDFQKGLLTVRVIQAKGLASASGGALLGTTNPYVELLLVDVDKLRCDERQVGRAVYNDRAPRWDDKFDFVMVSAGSVLTVNVWDKTSALEMATSLKLTKARFQDRLMGRVVIPVADVVRNGRLRDAFALQDAESGTLEMKLEWANCYVDDYVD